MLKKAFILVIFLSVFGSVGGSFLAGLNIYTRSTTPHQEAPANNNNDEQNTTAADPTEK